MGNNSSLEQGSSAFPIGYDLIGSKVGLSNSLGP
jgi:hypothetical protein